MTFAVHADRDPMLLEPLQAEAGVHRDRNPMRQHAMRVPIHDHGD